MEDAVSYSLVPVMKAAGCCMCDTCRIDVTAIALNHLKPCYVVTKKGEIYAKTGELASQFSADIIAAITKGANLVQAKPRHNHNENP
jgi:competence protein ComFB